MTIEQTLLEIYPDNEARTMYQWIKEGIADGSIRMNNAEIIQAISSHMPIQYITGKAYFADFCIHVEPGVLIPRPETDELVYWIKNAHDRNASYHMLDLGTGSGCIAIALKRHFSHAQVHAIDYSEDALRIAQYNANMLDAPITFTQADILNLPPHLKDIDILISNPPYILPAEAEEMDKHVLLHEPSTALFVTDNDPLQFYKAIEAFAHSALKDSGYLYLELHSIYAEATTAYYASKGWITTLKNDMQGKPRMLQCRKSISQSSNT